MSQFDLPCYFKNRQALEISTSISYDKYYVLRIIITHLFGNSANFNELKTKLNLKNISFPMRFLDIQKLVKQNKNFPISILVLSADKHNLCNLPIISNQKNRNKNVLKLLMFKIDPTVDTLETLFTHFQVRTSIDTRNLNNISQIHYFFKIKNVQKLLNFRDWKITKDKSKNYSRNFYCEKCFLRFRSKNKMQKHFEVCYDDQILKYPKEGSFMSFNHPTHCFKVPVIGFCDFESVLQRKCERQHCKKCKKEECQCNVSVSEDINSHRPVGYSILFVDSENEVFFQEEYAGTDCVKHFYERLNFYEQLVHEQKQKFQKRCQINASSLDWDMYHQAKECHICGGPFEDRKNYRKVVDHDHVTGLMVGAAHSLCNLRRQGPYHTPIFFHNAQG